MEGFRGVCFCHICTEESLTVLKKEQGRLLVLCSSVLGAGAPVYTTYISSLTIAHTYIRNISMPAGIVSRLWEEKTG